ncbi:signal peptidase I [Brevibacterium metallidurans]
MTAVTRQRTPGSPASSSPVPDSTAQAPVEEPSGDLRRPRPRRRLRRIVSWVCGVLVAVIAGVLIATVALPLAMGWIPLTVTTGSMDPTIPPGSQVIVKPLKPAQAQTLDKGQVVTYQPNSGQRDLVTHRIIDVARVHGETVYRTKGDNNNAADPDPVRSVQVRGVVRYHVPYVGYIAQLTNPEEKRIGIWIIAGALVAYAVWEIAKPKRRKGGTNRGKH